MSDTAVWVFTGIFWWVGALFIGYIVGLSHGVREQKAKMQMLEMDLETVTGERDQLAGYCDELEGSHEMEEARRDQPVW